MSARLIRDLAALLAVAGIAILAWISGLTYGEETWTGGRTGSATQSTPLSAPTETPGPALVMVITATPDATRTATPTLTPWPTSTIVPDCGPNAIKGQLCIQPYPTKPPVMQTPIPIYDAARATPGSKYIYQPTELAE